MICPDCRSSDECAGCKGSTRALRVAIRLAELERQVAALVAFVAAMPDGPVIR